MSVSNSVFVLHLLIGQEVIASFRRMHTEFMDQTLPKGAQQSVDAIYDINAKLMNCVLNAILARTENLHFAMNGPFMHRRSHLSHERVFLILRSTLPFRLLLNGCIYQYSTQYTLNKQGQLDFKITGSLDISHNQRLYTCIFPNQVYPACIGTVGDKRFT